MNCLVEAQHWIAENFQNDIDDSPDLQADYHFSTKEVIDGFKKLKNSALGLDGISKSIIFPIIAKIFPAVALLFTALLRFSVPPSDWKIALLALFPHFAGSIQPLHLTRPGPDQDLVSIGCTPHLK